jgi:hypothetical protein
VDAVAIIVPSGVALALVSALAYWVRKRRS